MAPVANTGETLLSSWLVTTELRKHTQVYDIEMICSEIKSNNFPDAIELLSFDLRAKQRWADPALLHHPAPCNWGSNIIILVFPLLNRLAGKVPKQVGGKKRTAYAPDEDQRILRYTQEKKMSGKGGVAYWKKAALDLASVLTPARTWQSIKDRYFNHIVHLEEWATNRQKRQKTLTMTATERPPIEAPSGDDAREAREVDERETAEVADEEEQGDKQQQQQ